LHLARDDKTALFELRVTSRFFDSAYRSAEGIILDCFLSRHAPAYDDLLRATRAGIVALSYVRSHLGITECAAINNVLGPAHKDSKGNPDAEILLCRYDNVSEQYVNAPSAAYIRNLSRAKLAVHELPLLKQLDALIRYWELRAKSYSSYHSACIVF